MEAERSPVMILGYWAIRGLAQPIRFLLEYVGEPYEDRKYVQGDGPEFSREEWLSVKHTLGLAFPNLPYLIDGEVKLTQSNAILRYIARKHNLLGSNEEETCLVDMLLDEAMDFRNGLVRTVYNPDYENLWAKYTKDVLPGRLAAFEKFLGEKPFFIGDKITVVDFPLYELLDQHRLMKEDCLEGHPRLKEFLVRFEQLDRIAAYLASDRFAARPVNNKVAAWK
ncbi:Glutathione S-transferase Mu 3 [Balamuthia mandrillaris]